MIIKNKLNNDRGNGVYTGRKGKLSRGKYDFSSFFSNALCQSNDKQKVWKKGKQVDFKEKFVLTFKERLNNACQDQTDPSFLFY